MDRVVTKEEIVRAIKTNIKILSKRYHYVDPLIFCKILIDSMDEYQEWAKDPNNALDDLDNHWILEKFKEWPDRY